MCWTPQPAPFCGFRDVVDAGDRLQPSTRRHLRRVRFRSTKLGLGPRTAGRFRQGRREVGECTRCGDGRLAVLAWVVPLHFSEVRC